MRRLFFYFRYAAQNIRRGGRWTTLAIFCIAAGVATIVALRSLGLAIGDSLVNNVRIANKGDISIRQGSGGGDFNFGSAANNDAGFSDASLARVDEWTQAHDATWTAYRTSSGIQIAAVDFTSFGRPQFISSYFIDPSTYPPSHNIVALDPAGVPLSDLFTGGNDVVVSENMAQSQDIQVGDTVRISGTDEEFTVRGIVAVSNEAGVNDLFAAFFGYAYVDIHVARAALDQTLLPNYVAIALPEGTSAQGVEDARNELDDVFPRSYELRFRTTPQLIEQNKEISQIIGDFIVTLGLGAMLIGGIGIMNTMLVLVRRRTNEIAAMKTFGMKGRQVAALFAAEAFLYGVLGSIIGVVLGSLMSAVVNSYGEAFLQQELVWRIYPEAVIFGLVIGLLVSVIFGVAPILTAVKVRPNIILRPNETHIPALGIIQTLGLIIFTTVALGLIVGQIVTPTFAIINENTSRAADIPSQYVLGILGVGGTFIFLGFLIGLLWIVVWFVGKLPAFGSVDLRIALRNLSTNRVRTATTLLALSAGMFALSSITFVGQGTRELLNLQLVNQIGGNVLIFPLPLIGGNAEASVENVLKDIGGITYKTVLSTYSTDLVAIDGKAVVQPTFGRGRGFDPDAANFDDDSFAIFAWSSLSIRDTDNPDLGGTPVSAGRDFTPDDHGKPYLVGPAESAAKLNISVGSTLTYRVNGRNVDFEVIGLTTASLTFGGNVSVAPGSLAGTAPDFSFFAYYVEPQYVNQALVELSSIPVIIPLDVSFIDQLLSRLIDQFAAIPTVVGLLSLLAAAVIMANTVALATLERRRQIGIFKAIGLKGRRVLTIMLIETTLIGLLSAVIGLGLSSLIVSLFTSLGGLTIPLPSDARLTAFALLIAAIGIGWLATFLSARVAVGERVMNVLRYE